MCNLIFNSIIRILDVIRHMSDRHLTLEVIHKVIEVKKLEKRCIFTTYFIKV